MSCYSSLLNSCPNLQQSLNDYFDGCMNGLFKESLPQLEFLLSETNTNGIAQSVSPGGGKVRKVDVRYKKRLLESSVSAGDDFATCATGNLIGDCLHTYEIDPHDNYYHSVTFKASDLQYSCEANPMYFEEVLMMLIDVVERKVATRVAQDTISLIGNWASDVSGVTNDFLAVKTLKDGTTQDPAFDAMEAIDLAMMKTGYCMPAVIFASDTLYKYYRLVQHGCCAATGVDLGGVVSEFGKATLWDRRIQSALGGTAKNILVGVGALQLLTYNNTGWKDGMPADMGANYFQMKMVSPRTGLPFDVKVWDNCGNITIRATATSRVVGMPADMFASGDVFDGVTYVNGIQVVNV